MQFPDAPVLLSREPDWAFDDELRTHSKRQSPASRLVDLAFQTLLRSAQESERG